MIDFSENGILAPKEEHQSKYFSQVGYTLLLICAYFWIDDCKHLSEQEKAQQKAKCDKANVPHILRMSFVFISDDMVHDTTFVDHCIQQFTEFVQSEVTYPDRPFKVNYVQSDGCAAQFANATHFLWILKQQAGPDGKGGGVRVDWTFFFACVMENVIVTRRVAHANSPCCASNFGIS